MRSVDFSKLTKTANAIRFLAMDAVQKANSGHPGAPMGMADIADVLWRKHLKHNPTNPHWYNRDRFVLSNGHASMLLYSLLHLSGYDLSSEDLQKFRQFGSKTAGHPENHLTPGVETTTGPLGQGIANAVGMALAEKILAARYNRPNHEVIDHRTWVFLGDGCLMEGVSHEAASLAGTWQLNKLVVFYDANQITIDGDIVNWFTDDTAQRFTSYGWRVLQNVNGHDAEQIEQAITTAKAETKKPVLIICNTIIGCGSPNKGGTADTHGSPLGNDEIQAARSALGWNDAPFSIPSEIAQAWDNRANGQASESQWQMQLETYKKNYPNEAAELLARLSGQASTGTDKILANMLAEAEAGTKAIASRKASENCLAHLVGHLPEILGGSADLACSNLTDTKQSVDYMDNPANCNRISYGVREFGMAAIANGISLHGGFRPFVATFLVFSDYMRNAIRMAALMKLPVIYVLTHDSIGLGEDGPTHQPIEHIPSLRMIPNLNVWRPCDALETAIAWQMAIKSKGSPNVLALSRQALNPQSRNATQIKQIELGAYVLSAQENPQAVIIATGSEVDLAIKAQQICLQQNIAVNVVSMPCGEIFAKQSKEYQNSVLPANLPRVAVEAAHEHYWRAWVGLKGEVVALNSFGESAPAAELFAHFGITSERIVAAVKKLLS